MNGFPNPESLCSCYAATLHGLHVGFLPPSLQRSCSRWSWEPDDDFLLECTSSFTFSIFYGQGKRQHLLAILTSLGPCLPIMIYHVGLGIPHSMSDKKDLGACRLHMAVSQHFSHSSVSSTESWKRRSCRKFSWSSCEHVNVQISNDYSHIISYNEAHDHNYSHLANEMCVQLAPNSCLLL